MARENYGGKRTVRTEFGRYVPSKNESPFEYVGSPHPKGRIHRMPVPDSKMREIQRYISRMLRERGFVGKSLSHSTLDSRTLDVVLPSLGFIVGAVLLSGNLTGNAILNSTQSDANLAGAFAIIIGIIGLLIFRRR